MLRLEKQKCFNHGQREAVARCPSCSRFYCRECVVEHEDKLVCSSCLKKLAMEKPRERQAWRNTARGLGVAAMFVLLWYTFFALDRALLSLPASIHEGTLWKNGDDD